MPSGAVLLLNPSLGRVTFPIFRCVRVPRPLKVFAGALLGADLHTRLYFAAAWTILRPRQRVRERLFDVNILACFASHDHGMACNGQSGDDHRLDVLLSRIARKSCTFGLAVGELEGAVQIGLERSAMAMASTWAGPEEVLQVGLAHSPAPIRPTAMRSLAPKTLRANGPAEAAMLTAALPGPC